MHPAQGATGTCRLRCLLLLLPLLPCSAGTCLQRGTKDTARAAGRHHAV